MKKKLLVFFCSTTLMLLASASLATDKISTDKNAFSLVHWSILKNMYKINGFVYEHKLKEEELTSNQDFSKIVKTTFTPDSYAAIIDQNSITLIHPDTSLLGKKLSSMPNTAHALK